MFHFIYSIKYKFFEVEAAVEAPAWHLDNYSPSLELLKDAGLIQEIQERPVGSAPKFFLPHQS